mmetsp:Transcript_14503/g.27503  ORF Transcript_14503/g.27503 Transcript_14503/m.27503 type:complete len:84 (-) Transcript_14503:538-789(-)
MDEDRRRHGAVSGGSGLFVAHAENCRESHEVCLRKGAAYSRDFKPSMTSALKHNEKILFFNTNKSKSTTHFLLRKMSEWMNDE